MSRKRLCAFQAKKWAMLEPSITLQRRLNREEEVIALLEGALSVQERMRDLDMVARVSRKVIELQECAVVQVRETTDVPNLAKIINMIPEFEQKKRATFRYTRCEGGVACGQYALTLILE
ncbi:predicted protein [Sclerotinia sclerotiorum 1980 UF-70]|uniref:Uncharacterized protein n=1 Tax=Sclerotinia sclerotiorum (strain ATCC 18683 / 1980 / Ss-1) TaxID=665079 RepID=A7EH31_SCLS1|nr:predicted protein [Sclerotinia sclerotiorum 1980 UF-70]EDO02147.1 predicted protein [Sclerotinia sclerotiorum 1980 UF-70]